MARPSNKSTSSEPTHKPTEAFTLPAPIPNPEFELMYLLGHLRGRIATADRIAELVLTLQAKWELRVAEALEAGRDGR